MTKKFYITTAIDYVNAPPHIGHAFEKVLADALARYHRIKGDKTFYLTGTDENAQKNAEAAKVAGIPTQKFVDQNSKIFIDLCKTLNLSNNDFIRTTKKFHKDKAREIFQIVADKGDIYKGNYEGLYCQGCEEFKTEKDLINGKCPEHGQAPKQISEEAYFFKLSKYKKQLEKFIPNYIVPKQKAKEILSRLKEQGLKDLCVSRTNLDWGITSPIDDKFKIYVWFDALINYVSGAKDNWPADVHVVGKGINWFHSVIWPAMLMSAKIKLPKKLLVHGYLTFNGQKISKSLGNTIDPRVLAKKYPIDSIRYNLLRGSTFEDFDFSETELIERHNNELANKLGNLVSRTSSLTEKYGIEKTTNTLLKKLNTKKIDQHFENLEVDKALQATFAFIDQCNEFIQNKKPWETKSKTDLYQLVESIREVSILLEPFIPESAQKIQEIFKTNKIKKSSVLFQKIEQKPIKAEIPNKTMENVSTIKFEDFTKVDLRVAKIKKAEDIEDADKLYKLTLDDGTKEPRIICAGIKEFYKKDNLKNKSIIIVANLAPRKMRGIESRGMLLAASTKDHKKLSLISSDKDMQPGSQVE